MPLFDGMPAFPGDPTFGAKVARSLARGDAYNLSTLRLGSHTGTHIDPPRHFLSRGTTVDELPLAIFNGPCEVVWVPPAVATIGEESVRRVGRGTSRVLFRTSNSARWSRRLEFFPDYVALDLGAARSLRRKGVRLVGVDALSIERDPKDRFPVHRDLLGHGVTILEGLLLDRVRPGRYALTCLPLRIRGGDGGPARAALSPLGRAGPES